MNRFKKIFSLFILLLRFDCSLCQNKNLNWPKDKTKPFPYPTPGPININTFRARPIRTQTPLKFTVNPRQTATVENTGSTLISTTSQPELATFSRGILYEDVYYFYQDEFYWDLNLGPNTAVKVDGIGAPVQIISTFYNIKYGNLTNAMTKRDGIVQTVILILVGPISNFKFVPFQRTVQSVTKAGTKKRALEYNSYNWFYTYSLRKDYYAYPGQYTDLETNETYYSATVIEIPRLPPPIISYAQFNATFASLMNEKDEPFSHKLQTVPTGPRPIVHGKGMKFMFK